MGGPYSQGCLRCRKQKIKCDASRPRCVRCSSTNVDCPGYSTKNLRFTAPITSVHYRRKAMHMKTEEIDGGQSMYLVLASRLQKELPLPQALDYCATSVHRGCLQLDLEKVRELTNFGVHIMWPMYMNSEPQSGYNPLAVRWAPVVFNSNTLFYSALFAFSKFRQFLQHHCPDKGEQLLYLKLAFSNLRLELSEPTKASTDLLILSALSLVPSETLGSEEPVPGMTPWMPPWHALYMRTTKSNPHVRAAFEMVKLRGGVDSLELFGLQRLIAYNDVRVACSSLELPQFRLPTTMSQALEELRRLERLASARRPGAGSGSGFRAMFEVTKPVAEFSIVVNDFVTLCDWLKHGQTNDTLHQNHHTVVDMIVSLMHRLLSLQAVNVQFQGLKLDHIILKACWLAALLYSFQALFPLPKSAFPCQQMLMQLAMMITSVLSSPLMTENEAVMRALFWCAAIGRLAASGTAEVAGFVVLVEQLRRTLDITSDAMGLSLLHSFVWPEQIYSAHDGNIPFFGSSDSS